MTEPLISKEDRDFYKPLSPAERAIWHAAYGASFVQRLSAGPNGGSGRNGKAAAAWVDACCAVVEFRILRR